ncbi:MAG: hypothetical protein JNK04_11180 [Myxococcales bacterium]|nr:hypothetical protein [Myxococcales bacterium]
MTQKRDAKSATARVADDAPEPKAVAPAPPPPRRGAAPTPPAPVRPAEVRREQVVREQVVRERVVERTLVDRLVVPQRQVSATEQPASPLPSIVRAPERKESAPKQAAPDRDTRGGHERPEPQTSEAPRPRADSHDAMDPERGEHRRPQRPPQAPERDAAHEVGTRPAPAARNAEVTALGLRNERRERLGDSKGQTPRAAPGRAVANMVAPRPAKVPATPARASTADAPRRAQAVPERAERPAPRLAPAPRIQISIGRIEVKSKPAEPALQRGPVTGPRSHQIDPGLGFGPLDGGRV